ncbi:radical SAM family heme chaperone HemW [Terriglobus aquaticus]|uniref:Heme chaperone HemW n=1 Tax=Terriglobus aquaticus TaxID=940139 RepID=A0ABW9KII2_9BACT|nr:radical SAM family heme chaperone HemW [Terriglobus aquaticus]
MASPVGIYISVPFCRAKCSFCNFASDAFPPERMQAYVDRLIQEIQRSPEAARALACEMPRTVDSIYLGGGTPSLLSPAQISDVFGALRRQFDLLPNAEISLEAAPGQIAELLLESALLSGINRVSLGVQSFVDREARAVGRLHTGDVCRAELERLQAAGVPRLSVDLIAGLPYQTPATWTESLRSVLESPAEHVSVYMLETDGDSRLGTEVEKIRSTSQLTVLGEQARYHASAVPSEEMCADLYHQACDTLASEGFAQYEISNFARPGAQSRHNLKYWQRAPYLGFGLDAHSMLLDENGRAVRFQNADELDGYLEATGPSETLPISDDAAFEEAVFLGLRLAQGVSIADLAAMRQPVRLRALVERARELSDDGLMTVSPDRLALTAQGRVLSSSVFGELLTVAA